MFAVGHLALGYITAKPSSRITEAKINLPLLFTLSILPDIDLLIPYLEHRGPTHSIVVMILVSIPFFIAFRRTVIPYLIASVTHSILGDSFAGGGVQLFWPISQEWYGLKMDSLSPVNTTIEWILFLASVSFMIKTRDLHELMEPHPLNLTLIIPAAAIAVSVHPPFQAYKAPLTLIVPHIIYLVIFALSILRDIYRAS